MVSFPTLYSNLFQGRCLNYIGTEGYPGYLAALDVSCNEVLQRL
jgi:hypothetical protein